MALLFVLVRVHAVLKWLHPPRVKYVMLWQPASASHDCWHAARLDTFPGDSCRYTSPAVGSHMADAATSSHTISMSARGCGHVSLVKEEEDELGWGNSGVYRNSSTV